MAEFREYDPTKGVIEEEITRPAKRRARNKRSKPPKRKKGKPSKPKAEKPIKEEIEKRKTQYERMDRPISVRGAFEEGTEVSIDSTIIGYAMYNPSNQRLYIVLKVPEGGYTYYGVSFEAFNRFKLSASKGRHFNKYIRNSKKWGFHYKFKRGMHL